MLVKILGFLKRTEILGLHCIKMSSKTPVKFLGYFIRAMFLKTKNPWPTFACQNLGTFKEYKDIGLTSYRNLRFSTFQHLGVFQKNHVYWCQKTHGLFCLSKSWDFKREQDFGPTIFKMSSKTPVKILGYFIRTKFLTHTHKTNKQKNTWPILLVKILGLLKGTKILGLHRIEILGLAPVKILGYFIRTKFLTPKPNGKLLLVKILGFLKSAKILGLHCIKISGLTPVEILGYFLKTSEVFDTKNTLSIWLVEILGFFF